MYIHSVYKESPRQYLSIEIKYHKFWKLKTHLYNHHSSEPGHITEVDSAPPKEHGISQPLPHKMTIVIKLNAHQGLIRQTRRFVVPVKH